MIRDWQRIRAQLYRHRDGTFIYGKTVVGGGADWYVVLSSGTRIQPPFDSLGDARTWYEQQTNNNPLQDNDRFILHTIVRDELRLDGPGWSKVKR
jgi:hypothetical protein